MRNVSRVNATNQISYSKNARLYADPGERGKVVAARSSQHGSRNVIEAEDFGEIIKPTTNSCLAIAKSGEPCKACPAGGESFCTFHKE